MKNMINLEFLRQRIPPPTARNLWLWLAAAVACQNLAVFHSSQSASVTVFALLVWGGALICMEDQLESLRPSPTRLGQLAGGLLILFIIFRTSRILQWDGLLFLLAPASAIGLGLLCDKPRNLLRFKESFLCLLLIPAFALIMRLIPETPLSVATAAISGIWLNIIGIDASIESRKVMLQGGGVEVLGPCNGVDMMAQILCISIIFLLAFPINSLKSRLLLLLSAPTIGLISNTIRIALLAFFSGNGNGKGTPLFTFFHDDAGSLIFSGIAVFVFGSLYMNLLERELPPMDSYGKGDS
ncbi:MAG: exosortase/archaeosortase family protein [Cyanobacteriota bacterium]|jgi:cyanoexosortase A